MNKLSINCITNRIGSRIYLIKKLFVKNTGKISEESRLYLDEVLNTLPSMVISLNKYGKILHYNNESKKYLLNPIPMGAQPVIWEVIPFLEKFKEQFEEVIASGKYFERHREFLDYLKIYYDISIYPMNTGKNHGAVIRIDDVTAQEKQENSLRQSQKMEMVGTLTGGFAHDFNNVLCGIIGTASLINHSLEKETIHTDQLRDSIEIIETASRRAAEMVRQLLTLSRNQETNHTQVDLNNSLKNIIKICRNTLDKSIDIQPEFSEKPTYIYADITQIEQVILNLCVNASHAMTIMRNKNDKQGGSLSIGIESIIADSSFCIANPDAIKETAYWMLRVRDTGVGIPQQDIDKLFNPFFTTKAKGEGTGLGLSMVYSIIKQHRGFIGLYSEVGIGSTFMVYLPVYESIENLHKKIKIKENIHMGAGKVLIADDEAIMRKTCAYIFKELGYDTVVMNNGQEAVDYYTDHHHEITVSLLDIAMPVMSGKNAFDQMKKINPELSNIFTSGFKQDISLIETGEKGQCLFVQKPYTLNDISDAMKQLKICS